MLINLMEHLKVPNPLRQNVTGIVIDDKDPLKLGRVKIKAQTFYEGSKENVPWSYPKRNPETGGRGDTSGWGTPKINSSIMMSWATNDIYYPQFDGIPTSPQSSQSVFKDNPVPEAPEDELHRGSVDTAKSQPDSQSGHVWTNLPNLQDKWLSWFKKDQNQGTVEMYTGSAKDKNGSDKGGTLFRTDRAGNVQLNIPGNLDIQVHGKTNFNFKGDWHTRAGAKVSMKAADDWVMEGDKAFAIKVKENFMVASEKEIGLESKEKLTLHTDAEGMFECKGNLTLYTEAKGLWQASAAIGLDGGAKIVNKAGTIFLTADAAVYASPDISLGTLPLIPGAIDSEKPEKVNNDKNVTEQEQKLTERLGLLDQKLEKLHKQHDDMVQSSEQEQQRLGKMAGDLSGDNIG